MKAFGQWLLALALAVLAVPLTILALPWFFIHHRLGIRVLIGWDQLGNAYARGYPDEMISARAHRSDWKWRKAAIDLLFRVLTGQHDHCYHAYRTEMRLDQFPLDYRNRRQT